MVPTVAARKRHIEAEPLLTPAEVAEVFKVNPLTVTRWANQGWIGSVRTLGGHTRYREAEVLRLLHEGSQQARPPGRDRADRPSRPTVRTRKGRRRQRR